MRLLRYGTGTLACALVGVFLVLALFPGCGSPPPTDDDPGDVRPPAKKPSLTPMVWSGKGTLKGRVILVDGRPTVADLASLDSKTEDTIKGSSSGKGCTDYHQQSWLLGKDNGLGNVVVMLRPEKNQFFAVPTDADAAKDWKLRPEGTLAPEVTIDQPGCAFKDHVVVVFPQYPDPNDPSNFKAGIRTGQKLVILNEEGGISHSFKFDGKTRNTSIDRSVQPKERLPIEVYPDTQPLNGLCGVHPWMSSWIWVVDNPYFAITKPDGTFEIQNVPAGKCRIAAWHEVLHFQGPDGFKGEPIELKAGENVKDFVFKGK